MNHALICLFLLVFSSGCSGTKSLYPRGDYGERKLGANRYVVTFRGNNIQNVLLGLYLRCSEITLNNGYRYFIVTDGNQKKEETKLNFILTVNTTHTFTNIIEFVDVPIVGKEISMLWRYMREKRIEC